MIGLGRDESTDQTERDPHKTNIMLSNVRGENTNQESFAALRPLVLDGPHTDATAKIPTGPLLNEARQDYEELDRRQRSIYCTRLGL